MNKTILTVPLKNNSPVKNNILMVPWGTSTAKGSLRAQLEELEFQLWESLELH